jgi:hypothetical protein
MEGVGLRVEDVSLKGKKEGCWVKGDIRKLIRVQSFSFGNTEGCLQNFRNLEQPLLEEK